MVLDTWRYQILCVYLQLVNRNNLGEVSFTADVVNANQNLILGTMLGIDVFVENKIHEFHDKT